MLIIIRYYTGPGYAFVLDYYEFYINISDNSLAKQKVTSVKF